MSVMGQEISFCWWCNLSDFNLWYLKDHRPRLKAKGLWWHNNLLCSKTLCTIADTVYYRCKSQYVWKWAAWQSSALSKCASSLILDWQWADVIGFSCSHFTLLTCLSIAHIPLLGTNAVISGWVFLLFFCVLF